MYYSHHAILHLPEPIALIGAPGAGHQVTSATLASTLGLPLHDIRRKMEHRSCTEQSQGTPPEANEDRIQLQATLIEQALNSQPPGVIVLEPESLDAPAQLESIRQKSTLVFIERTITNLAERLQSELSRDPTRYRFMGHDPATVLEALPETLASRRHIYRQAKVTILAHGAVPLELGRILADQLLDRCAPNTHSTS